MFAAGVRDAPFVLGLGMVGLLCPKWGHGQEMNREIYQKYQHAFLFPGWKLIIPELAKSRPRCTNYPVVWLSLVGLTVPNSLSPGYLLVATAELAVLAMCWCCLIVLQVSCSKHTAYLIHGVHGSWNFTITNLLLPIRFYLLFFYCL